MMNKTNYVKAIEDFRRARRKADLLNIYERLRGKSRELLSYEETRKKLHGIEESKTELKEIPIDSIVGSVGRYIDFSRDFLPLKDASEQRWARVMEKATSLEGLPPIEVYKIGDAYFVLDGNHRVSVAKQLGSKFIEAYVTEVSSLAPLEPDTNPSDLIVKEEYTQFLEKTKIKNLRPESELILTCAGQYPILEEHIDVHRYFMGINQNREIPYEEAVAHWYDAVYRPIIDIIRSQGILRYFPGRTETDLYIWLSQHRAELEDSLGWNISIESAAIDLKEKQSPLKQTSRIASKIVDSLLPDSIESGPPPGQWREEIVGSGRKDTLFNDILVTISEEDKDWQALRQAIIIADREHSNLNGLHIVKDKEEIASEKSKRLEEEFNQLCNSHNIQGKFRIESGTIARIICERARLADLVISQLAHPPKTQLIARLGSGFRTMILRCPRPILAVPGEISQFSNPLLAYDGSPKAQEALFVSAYLTGKWRIPLSVITIDEKINAEKTQSRARAYLEQQGIPARYIVSHDKEPASVILRTVSDNDHDLIIIGGYGAAPIIETVLGSVVDKILNTSKVPILLCR